MNIYNISERSHVAMTLCYLCNEPKDILLHRQLRPVLQTGVYDKEPCDKCKEYMRQGIILISVKDGESGDNPYRTGIWVVVREEAVKHMFEGQEILNSVLQRRMSFIEDTVCERLGITAAVRKQ